MKQDWTNQAERGSPFMLHVIHWVAKHLGRGTARVLLYPIVLYFLLFAPAARRASYDYLRRVLDRPVHWWHVTRHIHHFAATILDRVFLLSSRHQELDIRLHNIELINDTLATGSGCILLGSHLGSFEVLRVLAILRDDFPLKILMQESHNQVITDILHSINPDIANTVISLGHTDSLLQAHEFVEQGYFLGMLGDRVVDRDKSVRCKLLGDTAPFPTGPMLAASLFKKPVILFFGLYKGGRCYDIYFEKLADRVTIGRKSRSNDLAQWTQKYACRIEYYARLSPYNWFNFYDFWEAGI
jgi:predicted LPLAT superfamily acyltransferase